MTQIIVFTFCVHALLWTMTKRTNNHRHLWQATSYLSLAAFDIYVYHEVVADMVYTNDLFVPFASKDELLINIYYPVTMVTWALLILEYFWSRKFAGDFIVMCVHHVATLAAILFSAHKGFHAVGNVVLLLHNLVDVILCIIKIGIKNKWSERVITLLYVLFSASWLLCRTYLFSYRLVWHHLLIENWHVAQDNPVEAISLSVLSVCHVYWLFCIIRTPCKSSKITKMDEIYNEEESSSLGRQKSL